MDFMNPEPILLPVVVLVIWSLIVMTWMVAKRLPAIQAAGLGPEAGKRTAELGAQLPPETQYVADNYNHLMEQPTIFYACAIALAVAGMGDGLHLWLAWAYVVLRIVHSIVQGTTNNVMIRFPIFGLSSLVLGVMAVSGALQLL